MKNNKLVVFDLDGTLNKTELYAVPAHKKALSELNIFDVSDELIISTFGARGQDTVKLLAGIEDYEKGQAYLHRVGECEKEFIGEFADEYDGVTNMLAKLKTDGYETAICSNSSERYITMVLKRLDIFKYIDYIQPLVENLQKDDTLKLLIDKVNPIKTVMVGDRIYDFQAAKSNNLKFIGCSYGFKPEEVASADIAVDSANKINDAVLTLIGI